MEIAIFRLSIKGTTMEKITNANITDELPTKARKGPSRNRDSENGR